MTITSELHSRGAAHQRAGTIDRELEREDSPAGRAYRDGMRQARREAEDGAGEPLQVFRNEYGNQWCQEKPQSQEWNSIETAPANGTPVDALLAPGTVITARLDGMQWQGAARIVGTNKYNWQPILAPRGWRRMKFEATPREAKEAAASTSPATGSVEHTSANQPPPRPPQPETIFALPKPAKRPKKPASAAEQLDLL